MCERLANATRELLSVHQRLYEEQGVEKNEYRYNAGDVKIAYPSKVSIKSRSSSAQSSPSISMSPLNMHRAEAPPLSTLLGTVAKDEPGCIAPYPQPQQHRSYKTNDYYISSPPSGNTLSNTQHAMYDQQQRQPQSTALSSTYFNWNRGSEIDFNSLEFLYDTGLFGQVVFDANSDPAAGTVDGNYSQQQSSYETMMQPTSQSYLPTPIPISTGSTSTAGSVFQPLLSQQQHQQKQNQQQAASPTTYNPSKSLWN